MSLMIARKQLVLPALVDHSVFMFLNKIRLGSLGLQWPPGKLRRINPGSVSELEHHAIWTGYEDDLLVESGRRVLQPNCEKTVADDFGICNFFNMCVWSLMALRTSPYVQLSLKRTASVT